MFPQWQCLSYETINVLMELSVDQVHLQFADLLDLKNHQTCLKEASLLDYFVAGFWWAKEMAFTYQQISFFMALLQLLLDNIKDKHVPFTENFKEFTRMLLATRQSSPSASSTTNPLFDVEQIKSITDYFKISLFQHYRLYEFLFTHPREDILLEVERTIEVVNSADFIALLEEGMSDDDVQLVVQSPAMVPEQFYSLSQDSNTCTQKTEEESAECEDRETLENLNNFSVEDVREVLREMTSEMLGKLQADFTDKLRVQEKTFTARLESLERQMSK